MSVLIIMFAMMAVFGACEPHTSAGWENVKKIDANKYAACLMDAQNEKRPLEDIKKECEDFAEIKKGT